MDALCSHDIILPIMWTELPYFSFLLHFSQFQVWLFRLIFNHTVIIWFSYCVVQEVKCR